MKKSNLPNRDEIISYIVELHNNRLIPLDENLFNDVKKHIKNKYGESTYIKKHILDNIDRNINKSKRVFSYKISNDDIEIVTDYIRFIMDNEDHIFRLYVIEAINERIYHWGFSENINEILFIVGLFESILQYLHIIKLHDNDEKLLIVKKRDKKKIKDAIDLLSNYTNDPNVEYYLKTIDVYERDLTKETLNSCFFCTFSLIIKEAFPQLSNKEIEEFSKEVMREVFEIEKDFRIYNNIEYITYKNYKLRRFTTK